MGDADYIRTRWAADPSAALAAEVDGRLVGSNFLTRWGSVGFFGPLSVTPEMWNRGVARALLSETMAVFDRWGVRHRGLFTFGESPKHVALYQSYGFLPAFLDPCPEQGGLTTVRRLDDLLRRRPIRQPSCRPRRPSLDRSSRDST